MTSLSIQLFCFPVGLFSHNTVKTRLELEMLGVAIFFLLIFPCYRFFKILLLQRGRPTSIVKRRNHQHVRLLAVLGSGGHTTEMLRIVKILDDEFSPICFVYADTDKHSCQMVQQMIQKPYTIKTIPRAREVKQSWATTVISTLRAIFHAIPIAFDVRPDLLLVNGPGTCIPIILASLLLQLTTNHDVKLVFIESYCRVERLSLTGRLLYYFADVFFVQWPQLCEKYPRAIYRGKF